MATLALQSAIARLRDDIRDLSSLKRMLCVCLAAMLILSNLRSLQRRAQLVAHGRVSWDVYVLGSQEVDAKVEEDVKWKHTEAGQEAYRTLRRLQEKKATVMDIPFPEKLSFRYGHLAQQHLRVSMVSNSCPYFPRLDPTPGPSARFLSSQMDGNSALTMHERQSATSKLLHTAHCHNIQRAIGIEQ